MLKHDKICFFKTPRIYIKDKIEAGLNQKGMFLVAAVPGIFGLFGLIASAITIFKLSPNSITLTLLWFLFIYGLFISLLIFSHQRAIIRMKRDRRTFKVIHKNIAEKVREYFTKKRNEELTTKEIIEYIKTMLNSFNDNYMRTVHRDEVVVTLKYRVGNRLYPIRVGSDAQERNMEPEQISESPVYKALNRTGKISIRNYLYVKNTQKLDNYETRALGDEIDKLLARSKDKYTTFIALPIRSGEISSFDNEMTSRKDLGILGFDLMEEYGFGNLDEYRLDIMACLTDLISEPVLDLIEKKTLQGQS